MKKNFHYEAVAFRIYISAKSLQTDDQSQPVKWNVTVPELAQELDLPVRKIQAVLRYKGWSSRVQGETYFNPTRTHTIGAEVFAHISELRATRQSTGDDE